MLVSVKLHLSCTVRTFIEVAILNYMETIAPQNESWSWLVVYSRLSLAFPLEMYSKFVLPNWTLLGHILKWVGKWPVTDHWALLMSCYRDVPFLLLHGASYCTCIFVFQSVIAFIVLVLADLPPVVMAFGNMPVMTTSMWEWHI